MTFNPNEHLMKLKMGQGTQDYLPVQWRLVWFRDLNPQGTIDTEELEYDTEREVEAEVYVWNPEKRKSEKTIKKSKGYARYRAIITDGKGGRATGTKSENAANFGDYGEKAETGAIGRALAALGYGTQFTGDELNEGHRIVDSPVDHDVPSTTQQNGTTAQPRDVTPLAEVPTSAQLKVRCVKLFGDGKWEMVKERLCGKPLTDDDMKPADCRKIDLDFKAREAAKKAS